MSTDDALRVHDYLRHILKAIGRVRAYVQDENEASFLRDDKTQDAVIRNVEITLVRLPGMWSAVTLL